MNFLHKYILKMAAIYLGKGGGAKASAGAAVQDARKEMTKTKEQLEEEKKISLSIR